MINVCVCVCVHACASEGMRVFSACVNKVGHVYDEHSVNTYCMSAFMICNKNLCFGTDTTVWSFYCRVLCLGGMSDIHCSLLFPVSTWVRQSPPIVFSKSQNKSRSPEEIHVEVRFPSFEYFVSCLPTARMCATLPSAIDRSICECFKKDDSVC